MTLLSLDTILSVLLGLQLCLDVRQLLLLLILEHLGVDVFNGSLDVVDAGSSDGDRAGGEYLEGGLGILDLVGDPRVKLWLIGRLLECLREGDDFDGEGKSAGAKNIDYSPVLDPDIFVFIVELLEDARELPGADPGLLLTVGSGAGDLAAAPDGGSCVRVSKMCEI